jgi:hypothetical protein
MAQSEKRAPASTRDLVKLKYMPASMKILLTEINITQRVIRNLNCICEASIHEHGTIYANPK